ncbi:hypothetical protein [Oryzibacter oryziterrae]|uniref:hypothetical protein n=1 Tax=Oryzibacter oryziterrae TaxID=2766474 RepID=UPI001F2929FC|nr:hypothetical protein [Oryzibacter oryziterrae]
MEIFSWIEALGAGWSWQVVVPALIAVLTPGIVIFARNEVRCQRLAQILYFSKVFPQAAQPNTGSSLANPSFEFVKLKYTYDLPGVMAENVEDEKLMSMVKRKSFGHSDRVLFYSSVGYMLVCFFGFSVVLAGVPSSFSSDHAPLQSWFAWLSSSVLISGGSGGEGKALTSEGIRSLTIAGMAFLGAYIASVRQFVRSLLVFDLSTATFVRQTMEIVSSMVLVTVLYRTFPDPGQVPAQLYEALVQPGGPSASPAEHDVSKIWIGLALAFGVMQESSLLFILEKFKDFMPWLKRSDDRFMAVTSSTPLEVIDGITFPIRYRLQECGIDEVQNLATYNPIMLHIESPFGIYETIDWVGQAQLCCVVGIERFLLMRQLNLRTIFDLERAVRSRHAPPEFDRILACVLFSTNERLEQLTKLSGLKISARDGTGSKPLELSAFLSWAYDQIGKNDIQDRSDEKRLSEFVEHFMRLIGDDLHVRRLRRIWCDISESLGSAGVCLPDDIDAPPAS